MKLNDLEKKIMDLQDRINTLDSWATNMITTLRKEVTALNKRNAESDADWDFYWTLGKIIVGTVVAILAILGAGACIGGKLC